MRDKLAEELKAKGLEDEIKIVMTGCFGLCALGPIMIVYPEGSFYSMVNVEDIPEIVKEHFDHKYVNEVLSVNPSSENIAKWICDNVENCYKVSVQESEGNIAIYERDE